MALLLVLVAPATASHLPLDVAVSVNRDPDASNDTLPDLRVRVLRVSPPAARADEPLHLNASLENRGRAASDGFVVRFLLNHTEILHEASVPALAPGERVEVHATWRAPPGNHRLDVLADPDGEVRETHENNNRKGRVVPVRPAGIPNLVVHNLTAEPSSPLENESVRFEVRVENAGAEEAAPVILRWLLDGAPLAADTLSPGLPPGAEIVVNATWLAAAGAHRVAFFADPDNELEEANETDNLATLPLLVERADGGSDASLETLARPDLNATSLRVHPVEPTAGEAARVEGVVANAGNAVAENVTLRLLVDGHLLTERSGLRLAPGETVQIAAPWTGDAGLHGIALAADPDGTLEESREDNNGLAQEVRVVPAPLPDLVITHLTRTPDAPYEGQETLFFVEVANLGDAPAARFGVRFEVDGSPHGADLPLDGLAPGATALFEASVPWRGEPGPHSLRVLVDRSDAVRESDEANNVAETAFEVLPAPDLTVRIVRLETPPPPAGLPAGAQPGPVDVELEACNAGGAPLAGGRLVLYAQARFLKIVRSELIAMDPIGPLDAGACQKSAHTWDAGHALGDVTLLAVGRATGHESSLGNNGDARRATFLVGGLGGLLLPV